MMILYGAIFTFLLLGVFGEMTASDAARIDSDTNGKRNGPVSFPISMSRPVNTGMLAKKISHHTGVVLRDVNNQELTRCGVHPNKSKKTDTRIFISDGPNGLRCRMAGNLEQGSTVVLVPKKGDQAAADGLKKVAHVERFTSTLMKHVVEVPWTVTLWHFNNEVICQMQRDTLPKSFKVVIEIDLADRTRLKCSLDAGTLHLAKTPKEVKLIRLASGPANTMIVDPASDDQKDTKPPRLDPFVINVARQFLNVPSWRPNENPAEDQWNTYAAKTGIVIRKITVQRGEEEAIPPYMAAAFSTGHWTFIIAPSDNVRDSEEKWDAGRIHCVYQLAGKQVPSAISMKINAKGACVAEPHPLNHSMVEKAQKIQFIHVPKQLDHNVAGVLAVPPRRNDKALYFSVRQTESNSSTGGSTFRSDGLTFLTRQEQRMK